MVKILDWYIVKRFIGTFFFILGIFCIIIITIDVSEKLDDFIFYKPPFSALLFDYYLNFIFFFGNLISPLCVFLAVIFFTSRLAQNTEIIPVLSSGISYYRLLIPYLVSAILITGMIFYLKAYLVPKADTGIKEFDSKYMGGEKPYKDVNIHRKVSVDKTDGAETFVYFFSFNQIIKEGYIFSMEKLRQGDLVSKVNCEKVNWNDEKELWELHSCLCREFDGNKERIHFRPRIDTTFFLKPTDINVKDIHPESMTIGELESYIEAEKIRGSDILGELVLEKYRRYAYPFSAIVLTLIGFAVSTHKSRGGTALQLGLGLVISFVFVVLIVVGESLMGNKLPTWLAVWYPNLLFFAIGIVLIRYSKK